MPIYEFRCRKCESIEESFQKINDPAPGVCSHCGQRDSLEKIVSQTSFQLKGGGWYSDLYGSAKKPEEAKAQPTKNSAESVTAPVKKEVAAPEAAKPKT